MTATATSLKDTPAWALLRSHRAVFDAQNLKDLLRNDPVRKQKLCVSCEGLEIDFSRNHITDETLSLFEKLADERQLPLWRDRLFAGEKINTTEGRAVLHTALRGASAPPEVAKLHHQMETFVQAVHDGSFHGFTGRKFTHVVNIGIGGSDLGPRLVAKALRPLRGAPEIRFVSNVDAADLHAALQGLNPATTLFIVVSKTFTTQETLLNAQTAKRWLTAVFGEAAVAHHFVAVSTNDEALSAFGIPPENRFPMWDWVGGRFSVWSSVGLAAALSIGWPAFRSFLDGAAAMDRHFQTAPLAQNLPMLLALTGLWYRNFWHSAAHAILPYAERLRELPRYLQQLEMESNGKCVTRDGEPVAYATAPVIFGECGSVGQHSFHQWLHQGTDVTPADFLGIREDGEAEPEHHRVLMANLVAQTEALMRGHVGEDLAHTNPGNRPSTTIWLDRLDPYHLGLLLALYEHKVFVQGVIWGINSFDQFGVELGKKLAKEALSC